MSETVHCTLTAAEQAMLLLYELSGRSGGYNLRCPLRVADDVDVGRLRLAIDALVQRHPTLRSRLGFAGERPARLFDAPAPTLCEVQCDFSGPEARDRWLTARSLEPFALFEESPVRFDLLHATCGGATSKVLMMSAQHVGADYGSLQRMVAELEVLYQGRALPELRDTLGAHCARSERERLYLASSEAERDVEYWRATLLPLPAQPAQQRGRRFEGLELRRDVPADVTRSLRAFARARGSTPYSVAMTAFALALAARSEEPEVVVGTPLDADPTRERTGGVGYFVNTVPLRIRRALDHSFHEHVRQTNVVLARAVRHGRLPFASLVEQLGLSSPGGEARVHDVMLTWLRFLPEFVAPPHPGRLLLDVLELCGVQPAGVSHDLVLTFEDRGPRLSTLWAFAPSAHDVADVNALADDFFALLRRVLSAPDVALHDLTLAGRSASLAARELVEL